MLLVASGAILVVEMAGDDNFYLLLVSNFHGKIELQGP
jgi:hypothetical protein